MCTCCFMFALAFRGHFRWRAPQWPHVTCRMPTYDLKTQEQAKSHASDLLLVLSFLCHTQHNRRQAGRHPPKLATMSWSGFKKNVGRATTQVMMKTGHVEKTSDREYETEERRYRTLESASLRLQKEAKGYLDSLRAMTASQMRIAETIDAFYGDAGAKDGVSRSYKQAVEDLDAETVKALDGPYRSVHKSLHKYAFDEEKGYEDEEVIREIEWEMHTRRSWTKPHGGEEQQGAVSEQSYEKAGELMDFIYRTTVLEPINRFCAYFPDINECESTELGSVW